MPNYFELHDVRIKYTEFRKIYNNLPNLYKSGSNDFDVLNTTMEQHEKTIVTCKTFPYVKLWLRLKDALKWIRMTQRTSSGLKPLEVRNNQTVEYISTSLMSRWLLKMNNLFIDR